MKLWVTKDVNETCELLDTSAVYGLTSEEARRRYEKNGPNELVEKKILSKKYLKKNVGEKIRVRYLNNEYVLDCTEVLKEELN